MISVVIPLYNKEQSIRSTLQSVLAQTYTDYEVIVIDDGSTDKSVEEVESLIRSLTPSSAHLIRLLHQPNSGVSSARNTGIMAAKGEYIAFLDGDDLWAPTYLEVLARLIADYPDMGLYAIGNKHIQQNELPDTDSADQNGTAFRGVVDSPWTDTNYHRNVWTGSSSSNKARLIEIGMFDTRMAYGEDLDVWWRLILAGGLAVDTQVLAFYRQDTENRAMRKTIPLEKHIPYYMDKFAEARANNVDFRRFFDREMIYRLYQYLFIPESAPAARQLAKKIDYSLQKRSMKWRMQFPYLYRLYLAIVGRKYSQFL